MNADDLISITTKVTKKWSDQRKREERQSRARYTRSESLSTRIDQTYVAWQVIPKAYLKASGEGKLPAHARQIFYKARGEIQERTGRTLNSVYFTQNLLPRYIREHASETAGWKVVYDARGHLIEPHTDENIPIGTLNVEDYLHRVAYPSDPKNKTHDWLSFDTEKFPTCGPLNRYSAILFLEKEGFHPLLKETKLAERYDLALMSTKGQSVVAARQLVDGLCAIDGGVPLLVLHDMDEAGFLIAHNLTEVSEAAEEAGRVRYEFENEINVIDLGLRLDDVEKWNLESEKVKFRNSRGVDAIATKKEMEFLRSGRRVELNAFASDQFIAWIESKLKQHGIKKVIPDEETLTAAFRRAYRTAEINRRIDDITEDADAKVESAEIPRLEKMIRVAIKKSPAKPWDQIVSEIAKKQVHEAADEESAC